jgi:NAD(P) transhydrogenase subunit alpha
MVACAPVVLLLVAAGLSLAQADNPNSNKSQLKQAIADLETKPAIPAAETPTPNDAPKTEAAQSEKSPAPAATSNRAQVLIASLTIFVLAVFVGFEVITKVPPTLHTPLMSGSNALSGITLVGGVILAARGLVSFSAFIACLAVILATINVVGGFLVTHRMLSMFKKR